jgi:hypothetical protein
VDVHARWVVAPADPTEAVAEWFYANFQGADEDPDSVRNGAHEICVALGYLVGSPRQETPT